MNARVDGRLHCGQILGLLGLAVANSTLERFLAFVTHDPWSPVIVFASFFAVLFMVRAHCVRLVVRGEFGWRSLPVACVSNEGCTTG